MIWLGAGFSVERPGSGLFTCVRYKPGGNASPCMRILSMWTENAESSILSGERADHIERVYLEYAGYEEYQRVCELQ